MYRATVENILESRAHHPERRSDQVFVPHQFQGYPDGILDLTQGTDGAMWFVEYSAERIGRISTT